MKPYELVAELARRAGKSSTDIAKELHAPRWQGTLHKYLHGRVQQPHRTTAARIARYFGISIDAVYDPAAARVEAVRKGLIDRSGTPIEWPSPSTEPLFARESSVASPFTPPARCRLSPVLRARLHLLTDAQLRGLEALIVAHLDALGIGASDAGPATPAAPSQRDAIA